MKNHFRHCCALVTCLLCFTISFSQQIISGKAKDATTGTPLPFASVYETNNKSNGSMTDVDGNFSLKISNNATYLSCSYLGYETQVKNIEGNTIIFELTPKADELKEVIVNSGENPAHPIIRKAIANRDRNNPEKDIAFTFNSYNKIVFDYRYKDKEMEDTLRAKSPWGDGPLFIMESVSEKKFQSPNKSFEKVIGTKVTGLKNPYFASLATDVQPFSFYSEIIELLNISFLSPIADGSLDKYKYQLEESLEQGGETIHIISFEPLPGKNFDGLKGVLYINTNQYAIQNVLTSPADEAKIELNIQQKYVFLNNKRWFPEQLNFELILKERPSKDVNIYGSGRSYIKEVDLDPQLTRKDFPVEVVSITKSAPKRDSLFWDRHRSERLSTGEIQTYHMLDSLGEEYNFDAFMDIASKLPEGKIPVGKLDIDLRKTFIYNQHEGFRLGTGLYTNEKLFENTSFGGYFGFGLRDNEWKYGGSITQQISRKHDFSVALSYENDLQEVGSYGMALGNLNTGLLNQRDFLAYQMDHIERIAFKTNFRAFKYATWDINVSRAETTPLYTYHFGNHNTYYSQFTNSKVEVGLRYAYKEKIINTFKNRYSMGTDYPVLSLNYVRGIKDFIDGDFNYNKIEARIEHDFYTKNLGRTSYRLQAGYVDRPLPYSLLFTGEGSRDKDVPIVILNTFQTMYPYEFLSTRYLHLFTEHDFGSLLFKTGNFRPGIVLHNEIGIGDLQDPEAQYFVEFKTQEKVFAETGLELRQLLRREYFNMGYLGLGIGGFYRYGAYALDNTKDNLVFKLQLTFSLL